MGFFERLGSRFLRPMFEGRGVALMFHRVLPEHKRSSYRGLRGLEVLPEVYDGVISYFKKRKYKFISAAELADAIRVGDMPDKFVIATFDDGYKDNSEFVAEYMQNRGLPWTLFLTTGFCDRTLPCWWYGLGRLLDLNSVVDARALGGPVYKLASLSINKRNLIYDQLRHVIHKHWADDSYRTQVTEWFTNSGIDLLDITDKLAMDWDDIRKIHSMGCEVAGHTVQHLNLRVSSTNMATQEMILGKEMIERTLHTRVRTFAYPYGDENACAAREFQLARDSGFEVAFTTRNSWLPGDIKSHAFQLPRLNVSGSWDTLDQLLFRINGWSVIRSANFSTRLALPTFFLKGRDG